MASNDELAQRVVQADNLAALGETGHLWDVCAQLRGVREFKTSQGKPFLVIELADHDSVIEGKIWSNAEEALVTARDAQLPANVKLRGKLESYKNKPQFVVQNLRLLKPEEVPTTLGVDPAGNPDLAAVEDLVCRTLVIDIETVPGFDRKGLPDSIEDALVQFAQRKEPGGNKDVIDARIGMAMGMSPFFGRVVSLAIGDGDAEIGVDDVTVLAVPPEGATIDAPPWLRLMSEAELLRAFWALAAKADVVVTFNGKNFDLPFLVTRSMIHGIPARRDLLSSRFGLKPHLDLWDLLSQKDRGPSKLEVICWALGIESPKGDMDGSMVAPAYARGEIVKIAEYNRHDVRATAAVFRKVRDMVLRHRADWS